MPLPPHLNWLFDPGMKLTHLLPFFECLLRIAGSSGSQPVVDKRSNVVIDHDKFTPPRVGGLPVDGEVSVTK